MGQGSRSKEALRVLSRWTQQHDRLLAANRAQVSSPFTLWRFQQAMAIYVITAQDPLQLCSKSWAFLPTESGKREMRPLSHDRERLKPPPAVMVVEKGIEIGDRACPADPPCGACLLLPTNRCKSGRRDLGPLATAASRGRLLEPEPRPMLTCTGASISSLVVPLSRDSRGCAGPSMTECVSHRMMAYRTGS